MLEAVYLDLPFRKKHNRKRRIRSMIRKMEIKKFLES